MFKAPVLQALYNLGDDNAEYLIRSRVPGATTVRLNREALSETGVIETVFVDFDGHLKRSDDRAKGGKLVRTIGITRAKVKFGRKNLT